MWVNPKKENLNKTSNQLLSRSIRYFGDLPDPTIDANRPEPVKLGEAMKWLNKAEDGLEEGFIGFVDENGQTLQFSHGVEWLLDWPIIGPHEDYIGANITGIITISQVVNAVRAFFEGTDSVIRVFRQIPSLEIERYGPSEAHESSANPATVREIVTREVLVEHCRHCGFRIIGIQTKCPNCGARL